MKPPRIHISYSDRHYHPQRNLPETFWYSCSQIALNFWKALSREYVNITYGNVVPDEPIDLLWTNRLQVWKPNVLRMAYFASVADYSYINRQIASASRFATSPPIEGLYTLKERWQHWLTLSCSDLILIIGNECIRNSFEAHNDGRREIHLMDCGVDTMHYTPLPASVRRPVFIHSATRFSVRKGSHLVAEAWRKLACKMPHASLVLLGRKGDYDIEGRLAGIPNVKIVGSFKSGSSQYLSWLSNARWVVLPSLAEGQAGTLLEAMSCGCVPIASRNTGMNADEYGGYCIDPLSIDQLCKCIQRAYAEWNEEKPMHVRKITITRHAWDTFDNHILERTRALLSRPAAKYPPYSGILARFILHELLNFFAGGGYRQKET